MREFLITFPDKPGRKVTCFDLVSLATAAIARVMKLDTANTTYEKE